MNKQKIETFVLSIVRSGSAPVTYMVNVIHSKIPHNRKVAHVTIGGIVALIGSWLANAAPHIAPAHFEIVVEALAWGIHGLGIAPIVKIVVDKMKLED